MHTFSDKACGACGDMDGCHEAVKIRDAQQFLSEVEIELRRAMSLHRPHNSLHETYAVILEEVDELWDECRKRSADRKDADVRKELLQIAAMATRAAVDLKLV